MARTAMDDSTSEALSSTTDNPYKQLFDLAAEEETLQSKLKGLRADIEIVEQLTDEQLGRILMELSYATEEAKVAQRILDILEKDVLQSILQALLNHEIHAKINLGLSAINQAQQSNAITSSDAEKILEVWGRVGTSMSCKPQVGRGAILNGHDRISALYAALDLCLMKPKAKLFRPEHNWVEWEVSAAQHTQIVSEMRAALFKAHAAVGGKFRAVEAQSAAMQSQQHSLVELQSRIQHAENCLAEVVKAQQDIKHALTRLHLQDEKPDELILL